MADSIDRRKFLKQTALSGLGLGLAGGKWPTLYGPNAPSETVVVGVMGVHGRGQVLAETFARADGAEVAYICDVDSHVMEQAIASISAPKQVDGETWPALQEKQPKGVADVRRVLDDPDVDALVIAAPDHWHATATIWALQAGKHVYVEKPCGHNAHEGELLIEAQKKYGRVVQMGTQQRSSPESIQIIQAIREGIIGRPYFAKTWYANQRGSIGHGQEAPVPDRLDYDLWQGPAPRTPYRDNVIHYNWHWFWRWGTGELCNNATHELDVARWALGVDFPKRVTSSGGRYHYKDDWEFYDTQVASYDFEGDKTITWEGRSCNGFQPEGRGRGTLIHGTEGTVLIDREGYIVYDKENREIWQRVRPAGISALDIRGGDELTDFHVANFLNAVRGTEAPHTPIEEGHKSVLLCHLGNLAQRTGRALHCDPTNGHILDDAEAMQGWSRDYEPGWEPTV